VSDETGTPEDAEGTDEPSPAPGPLDVLVFAPVGVVLTVVEDLPGLIAKGRQRVEREISNARVVGQVVVRAGQRDVVKLVGRFLGHDDPGPSDAEADHDDHAPAPPSATPKPVADPVDRAVVEQAFAGYDTQSASQVVRRLESLTAPQLRAVHRYEASHRNRRTILNRTQQLLGADTAVGTNGSAP
jgi:hypothetical protein